MSTEALLSKPESQRDDHWEVEFLKVAPGLKVEVIADGVPRTGPDGWPYLQVRSGSGAEPLDKVIRWLAGRGIGLVVNPHKMTPDYVFTYGMLWNFAEKGDFVSKPPFEPVFPDYVRALMREFLTQHQIPLPKVALLTNPTGDQADLVLSSESLGSPKADDEKSLAAALSWFLPLHYSIVIAPEARLKNWVPL